MSRARNNFLFGVDFFRTVFLYSPYRRGIRRPAQRENRPMKATRWIAPACWSFVLAGVGSALGQQPPTPEAAPKIVTIRTLTGLDRNARVNSPVYQYRGGSTLHRGPPASREWLQIAAEYQPYRRRGRIGGSIN